MGLFFERHHVKILMFFAFLLGPLFVLSKKLEQNNAIENWLPASSKKLQDFQEFRRHFGRGEYVLMSWADSSLDDPRVAFLANRLEALEEIERVETPTRLIEMMTKASPNLSREQAEQRLQGTFLGKPDPETGKRPVALVATLGPKGSANRPAVVARIRQVAAESIDLGMGALHLGGPPVVNAALDTFGKASINRLMKYLLGACVILAFVVLRDWRLAIIVLLTGGYAVIASQALVYATGGSMNLVMVVMTPLVLVVGLSGAVHMVNYWREAVREHSIEHAVRHAWDMGWKPCLFASLTAVTGLLSLATSQIAPVWQFGLYSAAGSLIVTVLTMIALPAALQLIRKPPKSHGDDTWSGAQSYVAGLSRHRKLIMGCACVLFAVAIAGLPRLKTQVKVIEFFPRSSEVYRGYEFIESNVAYLVPIETVVRFEKNSTLGFLDRLELVRDMEQRIRAIPEVGGTLSLGTFMPVTPPMPIAALRTVYEQGAQQMVRQRREADAFLKRTPDGAEIWRITARIKALDDIDYGAFLETVAAPVQAALREHGSPPGVRADFTGLVPVVYEAQQEVLRSLIWSFALAFTDILIVIIPWLRSLTISLVAMIPNLTPVLLVFGGLCWAGIDVDIASMMTASVALGIAVDGTLHFIIWFRNGLHEGLDRQGAVAMAMRHCGPSLLQTALLAGVGLSMLGFSSFAPVARFGWLLGAVLAAGLVGDLVLLPAMLCGLPGALMERIIRRRRARTRAPEPNRSPCRLLIGRSPRRPRRG